MGRVRIIPVLLLNKGGLYKTIRFQKPNYIGDPINTVKIFNEKEADELLVLDFTASKENRSIDFKKIAEIAGEAFMPLGYGGGIKSFDDAKKVFDAGYEKIVLNTILFSDINLIEKIASVFGSQAVVGSLDVKKKLFGNYKVYSTSGLVNTGNEPIEWTKKLEQMGVGEIILNTIDNDGTWNGYDLALINSVSKSINIPVIACGGAATINDLKSAVSAGASAVAAGSMFVYQRKGMGVLITFPADQLKM